MDIVPFLNFWFFVFKAKEPEKIGNGREKLEAFAENTEK
jgi:hypothetical protein